MKRVVLLLLLITSAATAQVGTWHTYTDMKLVRDVVAGDDGYWAATSGGVFHAHADGSFDRYTNVDGLSVIDYTAIAMDAGGSVIAGSSTGMINVYTPTGGWYEVSDITRAEEIPARGVTTIRTHEGKAYIGTEFGLAVYDLERREFGDTYQKFGSLPLRSRVNAVHFDGTKIWVATAAGVAVGDLTNINLKDPANWTSWDTENGEAFGNVQDVFVYEGNPLAILENNVITRYNGSAWLPWVGSPGGTILRMAEHAGVLYMITDLGLYEVDRSSAVLQLGDMLNLPLYPQGTRFMDIDIAKDGTIGLGSTFGMTLYAPGTPWTFRKPDGPNSNFFRALSVDSDGVLWAASGITDGGRGAYAFDGVEWVNHTVALDPRIRTDGITDAAPESGGVMWFATWGNGVFSRQPDGETTYYDGSNVPGFPGITDNANFPAVRALQFDSRGNLWTLHYLSNARMLGCRTPQGQWYFFSDPSLPNGMIVTDFAIDQFDQVWVMVDDPAFRGILIFNANRTPAQTSDDSWTRLRANDENGINADEDVTSLAVDVLGDMWIGTDRGLRTVFNPGQPDRVSKTCFNTRCNIEGQYITSIAVDPVNNKWLGTKEGVFVLSADGSDILAHYDTDNSPLLDDEIETLLIHPGTGVAYIATKRGLSSLVTAFVQPETTFGTLTVGPNPFRPGKDEHVMIDGLVEASIIKILSVSGDLVAEIATPGGRIGFWDGRTSKGDFAPSGIYFIVAAAPNGSQSAVAKVAVVRE
ncbi:MAG: hypothetical protein IH600_17380 [Bacteroidetes bacterium]|nr:hypothetical protein [Bacteroidota bacterium]